MAKLFIAMAGQFINRLIAEEIDADKKSGDYVLFYQKRPQTDDLGENLYNVCLYKQVLGGPVRGEDELKLVLDFINKKRKTRKGQTFQLINADEVNDALKTK